MKELNRTTRLQNKHFKDLNPLVFGEHICPPGHSSNGESPSYLLIHYVISGKGTLFAGDKTYEISAGQAFIKRPHEDVIYTADEKNPWHYYWIIFDGEMSRRFHEMEHVFSCPSYVFENMSKVFSLDSLQEEHLASGLFSLYREAFKDKEADNPVLKIKNYIELYFNQPIRVEHLAEIVNLNRNYLSRIFHKETGMSMKEYLTDIRMKYAVECLKHGMSVGETASALSYTDQFIFSKAFKKHYGVSPVDYRKQAKQML
ncbi:MAG: AraC family transcriptional regulator [Clostridia bacterium]|nr:AraC family transcriptional regulator [Clostridia bacterium]